MRDVEFLMWNDGSTLPDRFFISVLSSFEMKGSIVFRFERMALFPVLTGVCLFVD
jgi:hypothetical protein